MKRMECQLVQEYVFYNYICFLIFNAEIIIYLLQWIESLQANSYWLYNVPWGMYKALMYIKERYGNPTVILSENGTSYQMLLSHTKWLFCKICLGLCICINKFKLFWLLIF